MCTLGIVASDHVDPLSTTNSRAVWRLFLSVLTKKLSVFASGSICSDVAIGNMPAVIHVFSEVS